MSHCPNIWLVSSSAEARSSSPASQSPMRYHRTASFGKTVKSIRAGKETGQRLVKGASEDNLTILDLGRIKL